MAGSLAEALLMVTDLVTPAPFGGADADPSAEETQRRLFDYFLANALFHSSETMAHGIGRAHDLYLTDRPHLRGCGCYIDLPQLAGRVTGLSPGGLWAALFSFLAPWYTIELPDGVQQPIFIQKSSFLTRHFRFDASEVDRLFRLVSRDVEEIRAEVRSLYSLENIRPYHVLPFARWPLVFVGDQGFCVSVKLLADKATRGIHHMLMDPEATEPAERDRFLTYMGRVFEDYVDALFRRVFPVETGRFFSGLDADRTSSGKRCDGLIDYGDAIVLLEAKSTRFPLAVWAGEGRAEFEQKFADIFRDGAAQVDATIRDLEAGSLKEMGLDPGRIRAYYPIIVTLEELALHPLSYRRIREGVAAAGLLTHPKVRPIQAMDVSELEFLEIGLRKGRSLRELLEDKFNTPGGTGTCFGNFWILRGEQFVRGTLNSDLVGRFHEARDRGFEFFQARRRRE